MDLLDRSREPGRRPSQGGGSGGHRGEAPEMGRTPPARPRSQEGSDRDRENPEDSAAGAFQELRPARFRRRTVTGFAAPGFNGHFRRCVLTAAWNFFRLPRTAEPG